MPDHRPALYLMGYEPVGATEYHFKKSHSGGAMVVQDWALRDLIIENPELPYMLMERTFTQDCSIPLVFGVNYPYSPTFDYEQLHQELIQSGKDDTIIPGPKGIDDLKGAVKYAVRSDNKKVEHFSGKRGAALDDPGCCGAIPMPDFLALRSLYIHGFLDADGQLPIAIKCPALAHMLKTNDDSSNDVSTHGLLFTSESVELCSEFPGWNGGHVRWIPESEPGKGDGFYLLAMGPNPFRLNKTHRSSGRVTCDVGAAIVEEQRLPCMDESKCRHHRFRRIDVEKFRWGRPSDLTDTHAITRIRHTAPPAQPAEMLPAMAELHLGRPRAPARATLPQWAANPRAECAVGHLSAQASRGKSTTTAGHNSYTPKHLMPILSRIDLLDEAQVEQLSQFIRDQFNV